MEGKPLHVDDMVATPVSDGSWIISLGESIDTTLGRVFQIHVNWWAGFRYHPIIDEQNRYHGDAAPPELVILADTLEGAVRGFGADA